MEDNRPVVLVHYGLASSYDDLIEINYKLPTVLRNKTLNHEKRHSTGKYSVQDFKNDFQSSNSYFFDSLKFALMNPEALIGFFPFMYSYYKKIMTFNSSALYPFLYFGLLFSIVLTLATGIGFFKLFGYFSLFVAGMNAALLLLTHMMVRSRNWYKYEIEKPTQD